MSDSQENQTKVYITSEDIDRLHANLPVTTANLIRRAACEIEHEHTKLNARKAIVDFLLFGDYWNEIDHTAAYRFEQPTIFFEDPRYYSVWVYGPNRHHGLELILDRKGVNMLAGL